VIAAVAPLRNSDASVVPASDQRFDFPERLIGFGQLGLALVHAIKEIESPGGCPPHGASLGGAGGATQERRELLDESEDQCPSAVDDGRGPAPDGGDVDDVARALGQLFGLEGGGMAEAGLGHNLRMAYGAGGIQVLSR
jgi:hypothetical protein